MRKVRIKKACKAARGGASNGYTNTVPEQLSNYGGADVNQNRFPNISTRRTLTPIDRDEANVEVEKGEVIYGDINGDNQPEAYMAGGARHSNGGTPLSLPDKMYVFSDAKSTKDPRKNMRIKDPQILAMFGKLKKGGQLKKKAGYTPAELVKDYDLNFYRAILEDPNSDYRDVATAELMIKEYQKKFSLAALAAEAQKGFENGIPEAAYYGMEAMGLSEEDVMPQESPEQMQAPQGMEMEQMPMEQMPMQRMGGQFIPEYRTGGNFEPHMMYSPNGEEFNADTYDQHMAMQNQGYAHELPKAQTGKQTYDRRNLPKYSGSELETIWGNNEGFGQQYEAIQAALQSQDPDAPQGTLSEFGKLLVKQTRAAMKDRERYKGKKGTYSKTWEELYGTGKVDELSEGEIINAFLDHQKRNLALQAQGFNPAYFRDSDGSLKSAAALKKEGVENPEALRKDYISKGFSTLNKGFKKMGLPIGNDKNRRLEQATFHGYDKMLTDTEDYTDEQKTLIAPWKSQLQSGAGDEPGEEGSKQKQISPIDSYYTNTTAGHLVGLGGLGEPKAEEETVVDETLVDDPGEGDLSLEGAKQDYSDPWWLQDNINIAGNYMDKSKAQDQYPWAPNVDLVNPLANKLDPTFAAANLTANTDTATTGMQSIMNPQTFAANQKAMSGADNIAKLIMNYDQANTGINNQVNATKANIANQEQQLNAGINAQLYRDTMGVIGNDIAEDMAFDQAGRALYTQAITNKTNTGNLNRKTPNYSVDPSVGGTEYFTPTNKTPSPTRAKDFREIQRYYRDQLGYEPAEARKAATYEMNQSDASGYSGPDLEQQYAQLGGMVMGSNVFPFMFY